MKQLLIITFIFSLFTCIIYAQTDNSAEKEAIKKVIIDAYQEGINNYGDIAKIDKGFHPGFLMFSKRNNRLSTMTIDKWKGIVYKGREKGSFPKEVKTRLEFPMIDITEDAAIVKIYNYKGDKQIYTDYMILYKFDDGWKIVAKGYYRFP